MSKKPTISSITSGYTSTTALNANFGALRDGFDNTLSLDGSTPNAMNADFDMNSNDILNANEVNASALRLGGVLVSASNLNAAGATLYSDNYTGDGSTVAYTMSYQPFIKDNTQVYIDGVYQNKAGYETSGTTLTFSEAPPLNSNIEIVVARSLDVAGTSSANVDYDQGGSGSVTRTVEAKLQEFVSVKDFGAVGDGVTDDTAALLAAFNSLPKGQLNNSTTKVISFESEKVYLFTPPAFGIKLDQLFGFIIKGNFAEIKVPDGSPNVTNGTIMWFEGCVDGIVENLIFNQNVGNRTGSEPTGEHCVKLRDTSSRHNQRIKFVNCKFRNGVTDGFSMDTSSALNIPRDIELIDCTASGCYRGGAGIIDSNRLIIKGGRYFQNGIGGTNPKFGIDFEDNNIGGNSNFVVEGIEVYDNAGEGIQVSGTIGCKNGKFKNINFRNNGNDVATDVGSDMRITNFDGLILEDIYCKGNANNINRALIDFGAGTGNDLVMRNVNIIDANPTGSAGGTAHCIYMHSLITGEVDLEGITISGTNCVGLHTDVDDITIRGFTYRNGTTSAARPITGNADRAFISNVKMFNTTEGAILSGNGCVVDGFHSVDCSDTGFHLWFNGANGTIRNATIEQTSSIPAGQNAILFTSAPREISNVRGISAGTDYTGANIVSFNAGLSDSSVLHNIRPGFWTKETIGSDVGDANKTLVRGVDEQIVVYNTPITAGRTVTLPTSNIRNGDKFKIIRTAAATGAFNLTVATMSPSNKTLSAGEYLVAQYDGTNWVSVETGSV